MSKEDKLEKYKNERRKCTVWTRCMGYHRPVETFNNGKAGEHKERIQFTEKSFNG